MKDAGRRRWRNGWIALGALLLTGCGVGAGTVARDRFDYVSAISDSWKRQTLLNLVKLRYMDAPVYMDVTSVINQYAVEGQVNLGASWADSPLSDTRNVGVTGKYSDRPTITYAPLMGEKFTKSFMTPIPVPGILFLLQSGYRADYVLPICVHTINGLENQYGAVRKTDPRFAELVQAMQRLQSAGGMGMRVRPEGDKRAVVMFFRPMTDPAVAADLARVQELLGLDPEAREFRVVYGSYAENGTEIAILSRSMLQVTADLASRIEVPESDVAEGRVSATPDPAAAGGLPVLLRIHSGASRPGDAHVRVHYRDHWFWVDDRDYRSKLTMMFYMILSSLTETGGSAAAPIVTVPTN